VGARQTIKRFDAEGTHRFGESKHIRVRKGRITFKREAQLTMSEVNQSAERLLLAETMVRRVVRRVRRARDGDGPASACASDRIAAATAGIRRRAQGARQASAPRFVPEGDGVRERRR